MSKMIAIIFAAVLLTGAAAKPTDVPPISEEYGNPGHQFCDMGQCTWLDDNGQIVVGEYTATRRTRLTCADKTRFLMTAEDNSKHCIAF